VDKKVCQEIVDKALPQPWRLFSHENKKRYSGVEYCHLFNRLPRVYEILYLEVPITERHLATLLPMPRTMTVHDVMALKSVHDVVALNK